MTNYMQQALALAAKGRYTVAPNPMVGCIIERAGKIVGRGWHQGPGLPHAEVMALQDAGDQALGANVYVNLEPCSHHGRTPPCVDALIKAQVKTVHISFIDPNPLVAGKGIAKLRAAGIEVFIGAEQEQARQLNEIFLHYITTNQPFVIAKWAMSLDGKTATDHGHAKWISGSEARQHVHELRRQVSAILVGSKTIINDDPQLTVRLDIDDNICQPLRIILDSTGNTPLQAKVLDANLSGKTIIATTTKSLKTWRDQMIVKGVELLMLPEDENSKVDLVALLNDLGQREISSLLVEGGKTVLTSFFNDELINKVYTYVAPKLIGSATHMENAMQLTYEKYKMYGDDIFLAAKPIRRK